MKKHLVAVDNLDRYICQSTRKIYVDNTMILTAGAKDKLSELGIPIVYGPRPNNLCCRSAAQGYLGTEILSCPPGNCSSSCNCVGAGAKDSAELENMLIAVAAVLQKEYKITDTKQLKDMSCQIVKTLRENM